jgi:glucosamine 6-phosphate synthetase-like amidotransferase/phosphosugar isomerase protein
MCGIFGSFKFEDYSQLYNENKKRGSFSYGNLYAKKAGSMYIHKSEGIMDIITHNKYNTDYHLFLGHTQAPTSNQREFSISTTHPFEFGDWHVAHNGVLENYKEIIGQYFPDHNLDIDSSVIPRLIDYMYGGDEIYAISECCGTLRGTYACWIYNSRSKNTYVIRSGSTLFGNVKTGAFSSTKITRKCVKSLNEGEIYHVTREGLASVGGFNSNSPFFIF